MTQTALLCGTFVLFACPSNGRYVSKFHMLAPWKYERGEHRHKHCWANDWAGFVPSYRGKIGKCPSSITDMEAETLLNSGVPYFYEEPSDSSTCPDIIYNVRNGIPYEAVPTTPTVSFHAYPWAGRLPRHIRDELRRRAEASGHHKEFKAWMKEHGQ